MKKKVIKLTESDLERLVKKTIMEYKPSYPIAGEGWDKGMKEGSNEDEDYEIMQKEDKFEESRGHMNYIGSHLTKFDEHSLEDLEAFLSEMVDNVGGFDDY